MNSAVIDIGTNTILLLIVDDRGVPLVDATRFGRLGQRVDATGELAPEAIQRSLGILREYRAAIDAHQARATAIATQALREARNAAAFVGPAQTVLGVPIEVIAPAREAELAFHAVARTLPELAGTPFLVVDVGGGSTELIATDGNRVLSAVSVPIGAVRMTERHLAHDPPTRDEVRALAEDIGGQLAPYALPANVPVVGTAGTATTMAAMRLGLVRYDAETVTGLRLTPATVMALLARLLAASVAERKKLRGLEPERADVIAGGVAIFAHIVQRISAPVLITCDRGIRWGLAYEQLVTARVRGDTA